MVLAMDCWNEATNASGPTDWMRPTFLVHRPQVAVTAGSSFGPLRLQPGKKRETPSSTRVRNVRHPSRDARRSIAGLTANARICYATRTNRVLSMAPESVGPPPAALNGGRFPAAPGPLRPADPGGDLMSGEERHGSEHRSSGGSSDPSGRPWRNSRDAVMATGRVSGEHTNPSDSEVNPVRRRFQGE
jgi:hypothetical protein